MIQLQDVYNSFERYKRDIADVPVETFEEWCQFVANFIYNKVKGADPERFMQEETYTVSADPQTSSLPTDFKDLHHGGIYYVQDKDTDKMLDMSRFGSSETGYYFTGANVVFTGISGETVKMRYTPKPPVFTGLTDYFSLDKLISGLPLVEDEHKDYLVKAIDVLYSAWDEDLNMESIADFKMVRALGEVLTSIRRSPGVYSFDDHTLNF